MGLCALLPVTTMGPRPWPSGRGWGAVRHRCIPTAEGQWVSTCPTAPELLAACGEAPQTLQVGSAQGTGPPPSSEPCLGGQAGCTHEK